MLKCILLFEVFGGLEKGQICVYAERYLSTFTANTACELDIFWHDGHSLGVDGTQVGVFEKSNEISLTSFLESHDSRALESEISLEVLCNFSYETLEGQFPDQKFSALLVSSDFSQSNSTWSVSVWLLDTSSSWCTFTCSLGGQLFSWSFSSSRFSCSLLSSCHCDSHVNNNNNTIIWEKLIYMV